MSAFASGPARLAFMFNVTTSRPSRRKLSGARPPVSAGLSYPDGRGRLGLHPGGHTRSSWGAERPYFTGFSRSYFKVAEREGLLDQLRPIRQFPRKNNAPAGYGLH